jgi:redox-sensitive bicupin YhaK (pirin superfamily)
LYAGVFAAGERERYELAPGRHAWVQVVRGRVTVNGQELSAGDGAALSDVSQVELEVADTAEVLLFDLA